MPNKKHIGIVKRRLWSSGYSVVPRSRDIDGFDLLVDGRVKVQVGTRKDIKNVPDDMGVIACVGENVFGRKIVIVYVGENKVVTESPREMFGLPSSKSKKQNGTKKAKKRSEEGATAA